MKLSLLLPFFGGRFLVWCRFRGGLWDVWDTIIGDHCGIFRQIHSADCFRAASFSCPARRDAEDLIHIHLVSTKLFINRLADEIGAVAEAHLLKVSIQKGQKILLHLYDDLLLIVWSFSRHARFYNILPPVRKDFS